MASLKHMLEPDEVVVLRLWPRWILWGTVGLVVGFPFHFIFGGQLTALPYGNWAQPVFLVHVILIAFATSLLSRHIRWRAIVTDRRLLVGRGLRDPEFQSMLLDRIEDLWFDMGASEITFRGEAREIRLPCNRMFAPRLMNAVVRHAGLSQRRAATKRDILLPDEAVVLRDPPLWLSLWEAFLPILFLGLLAVAGLSLPFSRPADELLLVLFVMFLLVTVLIAVDTIGRNRWRTLVTDRRLLHRASIDPLGVRELRLPGIAEADYDGAEGKLVITGDGPAVAFVCARWTARRIVKAIKHAKGAA